MTVRTLFPAVLALAAALVAGCGDKQTVATDPESLKKAAQEIDQMGKKENAGKKENKAQP
ncbi:MAG: hypothetical protein J0I06_10150 [Planctomycetes bacterium]|nr:hypothetical protein [Planctomycetota bacterium]